MKTNEAACGRQRDTAYGVKWADSENGLGRGGAEREWVGPTERVGEGLI